MAVVLDAAAPPWPRHWSDQQPLLERQHDGLESLPQEPLQRYEAEEPPCDPPAALDLETSCRRLLWDLLLHLRLEERWLRPQGCLCPGQLANHRAGLRSARLGFQQSAGEREERPISIAPEP